MINRRRIAKFVALISRDDRPLYIQSFDINSKGANNDDANKFLKYNFLSHMALDIFSSPESISLRELQQKDGENDGVLLLFIQDETSVYGYETNNGFKIVVGLGKDLTHVEEVTEKEEGPVQEIESESILIGHGDLNLLFALIRKCYLRTICNPFTNLDFAEGTESILQSEAFDNRISSLIQSWNGNS